MYARAPASMNVLASSTWFTVRRMKTFASVILALDALLLLIWTGGAIYIITQLEHLCFDTQFIVHFFILIHFALAAYMATIIGEIAKEEERARRRAPHRELQQLPYTFYLPVAWIAIATISLVGDVILLSAGVRIYQLRMGRDECDAQRLAHIIFDIVATLISLVAIVWFIVYTIYTIKRRVPLSLIK